MFHMPPESLPTAPANSTFDPHRLEFHMPVPGSILHVDLRHGTAVGKVINVYDDDTIDAELSFPGEACQIGYRIKPRGHGGQGWYWPLTVRPRALSESQPWEPPTDRVPRPGLGVVYCRDLGLFVPELEAYPARIKAVQTKEIVVLEVFTDRRLLGDKEATPLYTMGAKYSASPKADHWSWPGAGSLGTQPAGPKRPVFPSD